ncbi:hypothetical protein CON36_29305 [Bacillus cereus]|uniref:Uncharacterized protein n=1 Tax=Bacillus cereus TaxID=1396 RepID=A0A9X6XVU6_BACCE|nr:hypothetical protein [Bacillus cereus]PDZ95255.1 hypothetical protein CON36_29305 [Bacillus cereus]PGP14442.1 hypothetical protein COA01_29185 [Bacillus cereus]
MEVNQAEKIKEFWDWFKQNELKLYNTLTDYYSNQSKVNSPNKSPFFDKLSVRLKRVNTNLAYEFFLNPDDNHKFEFYISAGGVKSAFPIVLDMVRNAPDSSQFKFVPFKSPHKNLEQLKTMALGYGDSRLNFKDIYFKKQEVFDDGMSLQIFIKDYNGRLMENLEKIFYILDKVIGEYDVATLVKNIEIQKLTSKMGLQPLFKLPIVMQNFKKEKNIPNVLDLVSLGE